MTNCPYCGGELTCGNDCPTERSIHEEYHYTTEQEDPLPPEEPYQPTQEELDAAYEEAIEEWVREDEDGL